MSIKTKWGVLSTLIYQMELHEYLMDFKEYINTHLDLSRKPRILDNIISASKNHNTISLLNNHHLFFKLRLDLVPMLNVDLIIVIIEDFKMICRGWTGKDLIGCAVITASTFSEITMMRNLFCLVFLRALQI